MSANIGLSVASGNGRHLLFFFHITTVQQYLEKDMPFVHVMLATHVNFVMAWCSPCLFEYVTSWSARHNLTHISPSERLFVKRQRPCYVQNRLRWGTAYILFDIFCVNMNRQVTKCCRWLKCRCTRVFRNLTVNKWYYSEIHIIWTTTTLS